MRKYYEQYKEVFKFPNNPIVARFEPYTKAKDIMMGYSININKEHVNPYRIHCSFGDVRDTSARFFQDFDFHIQVNFDNFYRCFFGYDLVDNRIKYWCFYKNDPTFYSWYKYNDVIISRSYELTKIETELSAYAQSTMLSSEGTFYYHFKNRKPFEQYIPKNILKKVDNIGLFMNCIGFKHDDSITAYFGEMP